MFKLLADLYHVFRNSMGPDPILRRGAVRLRETLPDYDEHGIPIFDCDGIPWIPIRPDGPAFRIRVRHYRGCSCLRPDPTSRWGGNPNDIWPDSQLQQGC